MNIECKSNTNTKTKYRNKIKMFTFTLITNNELSIIIILEGYTDRNARGTIYESAGIWFGL